MHRLKSYLFLIAAAAVLTACAAPAAAPEMLSYGDAGGGFDYEDEAAYAPEPATDRSYDPTVSSAAVDGDIERLVIKNADLSIVVDDPESSMSDIMAMAEEVGGFVVSSNLYHRTLESGAEVPEGNVTIRVPSARFDEALVTIKTGAGRVLSENVSGEDVTQEYTDLQSRLVNLEAAEDELQRIMEEATDTEDVLNVYNQLINIREQIEVIKGRIKYFEQSAAFSAISVGILADEAVQPLTIGGWQPVGIAKDAIQALINTLKVIANALIWVILFLLPVLLVLYIPFRFLLAGLRWWARRRKKNSAPPQAKT